MAEVFLKGAAYSIPFLVKSGKTTITNENVASVRLGLGNLTASWPGGRLRYSGGYWLFPVTQSQSYALPQGETYYQAQIQMASGETFSSKRQCIFVDGTIFRTPFGETQLTTPETADAQPIPAQIEPKPEQITVEIQTVGGGLPSGYVLPPATSDELGGIKADAKTENDTIPARIDADGKLWVKGQGQANWQENDPSNDAYVKNRPGGYDIVIPAKEITWDGNTEGLDTLTLGGGLVLYRVSPDVLAKEQLLGATLDTMNGGESSSFEVSAETLQWSSEQGVFMIIGQAVKRPLVAGVLRDTIGPSGAPLAAGVYFLKADEGTLTTGLNTVAVTNPVKIPLRYLDLPLYDGGVS